MTTEDKIAKMHESMYDMERTIFDYVDHIYSLNKNKDCISQLEFYEMIHTLQCMLTVIIVKHNMLIEELNSDQNKESV